MVGMGNLGLIDQVTETQWNAQLHSLITVKAVSLAWVAPPYLLVKSHSNCLILMTDGQMNMELKVLKLKISIKIG